MKDLLRIGGRELASRLFLGTGKFSSPDIMNGALEASGCEVVTIAMKRVDFDSEDDAFLEGLNNGRFVFMPNTSGARDAAEAVRIAKLCRAATGSNWIKVEIHPEARYLLPDPVETFEACRILAQDGFVVLPYINADPALALRLQEVGCAAVMPLAAPIGSNRGITVRSMLEIIIEQARVPVIVDAGLGRPSHAADCMEIGADAVLVNTAIAAALDPIAMAEAFKLGVESGRRAFHAGLGVESTRAIATSPISDFLQVVGS